MTLTKAPMIRHGIARRPLLTIEFDNIVEAMKEQFSEQHAEPTFGALPYDIRKAIQPKYERSMNE